jgi:hypothetical protein
MTSTHLIENGVRYYMSQTLKECRRFKDKHMTFFFNVSLGLFLIFILGTILYIKYKGKLTAEEQQQKQTEQYQYILSKLQQFAHHRYVQHNQLNSLNTTQASHNSNTYSTSNLITNLPVQSWENHPEMINLKIGNQHPQSSIL